MITPELREKMYSRWLSAFEKERLDSSKREHIEMVFNWLAIFYSSPDRHYHDFTHIDACLDELDRVDRFTNWPLGIKMALWFHDAIYVTTLPLLKENEKRSAELFWMLFGNPGFVSIFSKSSVDYIRGMIIRTNHKGDTIKDQDSNFVLDIDMSILGQSEEAFDKYEAGIRTEYSHVADETFRSVRAYILGKFLEAPSIYLTSYFRDKYEAKARANIKRSIQRLTKV